jgi:mono/diheme cytochrome c family protein
MKSPHLLRPVLLLIAAGSALSAGAADQPDPLVERGRYLTHHVAGCVDCHSPRDEKGRFIADRHLTGSVLGFAPTVPMPWAPAAPSLVGLEGYTPEQAVRFLMTGERPSGVPPLPPMPEYRLNQEDAKAVVAYLRSLAKKP